MMDDKSTYRIAAIKKYLGMFGGHVRQVRIVDDRVIEGVVGWCDESDDQVIRWENDKSRRELQIMGQVIDFIINAKIIQGDRITVTPEHLTIELTKAGWKKERADEALQVLCDIEVKMLDDGCPTDSFFVHF